MNNQTDTQELIEWLEGERRQDVAVGDGPPSNIEPGSEAHYDWWDDAKHVQPPITNHNALLNKIIKHLKGE